MKGKSLCHVTLLDTPGLAKRMTKISNSPRLHPAVRKTKLTSWQISEIYLSFSGGEESSYGWF
jgi:hypothetical protein